MQNADWPDTDLMIAHARSLQGREIHIVLTIVEWLINIES
jgi:hypothetical protein